MILQIERTTNKIGSSYFYCKLKKRYHLVHDLKFNDLKQIYHCFVGKGKLSSVETHYPVNSFYLYHLEFRVLRKTLRYPIFLDKGFNR